MSVNTSVVQTKLPAIFIGHGSPMNAIEDNPYTQKWEHLGKTLPRFHCDIGDFSALVYTRDSNYFDVKT